QASVTSFSMARRRRASSSLPGRARRFSTSAARVWPTAALATSPAASHKARASSTATPLKGTTWTSPRRRRTRMCSTVSNVVSPSLAGEAFVGALGDELVERRAFAVAHAQDAAQALHMFAHAAAAGDDDGHLGVGDVDALVQ